MYLWSHLPIIGFWRIDSAFFCFLLHISERFYISNCFKDGKSSLLTLYYQTGNWNEKKLKKNSSNRRSHSQTFWLTFYEPRTLYRPTGQWWYKSVHLHHLSTNWICSWFGLQFHYSIYLDEDAQEEKCVHLHLSIWHQCCLLKFSGRIFI